MPYLPLVPLLLGLAAHPLATLAPPEGAVTSDEATRSAAARTHYSERRYLEAARIYEQLWRDTQAAKYRFNAGMARSAAEHDGAAIVHWEAYLSQAASVTARERSMLTAEITAARQRTRPLQLKIQGPLAPATLTLTAPTDAPQGPRDPIELLPATTIDLSLEPGRWTATLERPDRPLASITFTAEAGAVITLGGEPPGPLTPPPPASDPPPATPQLASLTLTLGPPRALARGVTVTLQGPAAIAPSEVHSPEQTWQLPPGAWDLRIQSTDREPRNAALQLGPGERQRLDLQLRLDRPARTRLGLGLGLGIPGLGLLTTGAIVAARNNPSTLDCSSRPACEDATNTVLARSTGLALLGAGLGAASVALTAGLTRSERALQVETGLGGVLLTAGLAWYMSEVTRTTALDHRAREHSAATLLGLGGGMFGSAVIGLVVRRLTRDRPPPIALAPSLRGLSLAARF
jgi:hypothetical protein